jgi:hypothetical protein
VVWPLGVRAQQLGCRSSDSPPQMNWGEERRLAMVRAFCEIRRSGGNPFWLFSSTERTTA